MKIKQIFKRILAFLRLIRYFEWQDKIQTIVVSTLLLMVFSKGSFIPLINIVIFILYLYPAFSYGYLINSYADRAPDMKVGKDEFVSFSKRFALGILVVSGYLSFALPLLFGSIPIILLTVITTAQFFSCAM